MPALWAFSRVPVRAASASTARDLLARSSLPRLALYACPPLAPHPPHAVVPRFDPHEGPYLASHRMYAVLATRQGALAFNQPLSFDTSSVTSLKHMFVVRSARALTLL